MLKSSVQEFAVAPEPEDPRLAQAVPGIDQEGKTIEQFVVTERPVTIFLNSQEIVTAMTIGDHPDWLGVGYLLNQGMLSHARDITAVDYDDDLSVVVVRTKEETNFEERLKKRIQTSGCAQGTMFGELMESFDQAELSTSARIRTTWLYRLMKTINLTPSLYLKAGAIHGCVLAQEDRVLVYLEDVGRHNAADKIAGWMAINEVEPQDKIFYTTGRLTSEMVIKCVQMRIPILVSRSGFTASGVELARRARLTLIGRARGRRFVALSGEDRIIFDTDPRQVDEEHQKYLRKGAREDD
ncbi:MAG TPA: formate dehydrogenase accessory sulfurtransferase FdhD [Aestuariivirgaceae bacterium]|jgi:FdhD protein